jgi:hypothetical protein
MLFVALASRLILTTLLSLPIAVQAHQLTSDKSIPLAAKQVRKTRQMLAFLPVSIARIYKFYIFQKCMY